MCGLWISIKLEKQSRIAAFLVLTGLLTMFFYACLVSMSVECLHDQAWRHRNLKGRCELRFMFSLYTPLVFAKRGKGAHVTYILETTFPKDSIQRRVAYMEAISDRIILVESTIGSSPSFWRSEQAKLHHVTCSTTLTHTKFACSKPASIRK